MSYIGFFTFKRTHRERHYLMNPSKDDYSEAISTEKPNAYPFDDKLQAELAISNLLHDWDYGRDPSCDYSYVGWVENTATNDVSLCAQAS